MADCRGPVFGVKHFTAGYDKSAYKCGDLKDAKITPPCERARAELENRMIFDKATWESFAQGYSVYDVAASSPTRFWLELIEQTASPHRDPLPRTRFLSVNLKKPLAERFYFHEFGHFKFSRLAFNKGVRTEVVAVDTGGHVYCYAADGDREESRVATHLEGSDLVSAVTGVFRIGEHLYAVATDRRIFQRVNPDEWTEVTKGAGGIPVEERSLTGDAGMRFGFRPRSLHLWPLLQRS